MVKYCPLEAEHKNIVNSNENDVHPSHLFPLKFISISNIQFLKADVFRTLISCHFSVSVRSPELAAPPFGRLAAANASAASH